MKVDGLSNEQLNTEEMGELRLLCGQVLWATSQTRLDEAFEGCQINNAGESATKKHILDANRLYAN